MTPNQRFRSGLLRAIYLEGEQPVQLTYFHNHMGDVDSKRWLEENGLQSRIDRVQIGPWYFPKWIKFIHISEQPQPEDHLHETTGTDSP